MVSKLSKQVTSDEVSRAFSNAKFSEINLASALLALLNTMTYLAA